MEGLLPREFLEREQRRKFIETVEYQQIQQILADAVERFGLLEGATPTRITDFMVHLPPVSKEEPSSGIRTTFGAVHSDRGPSSPPTPLS